MTQPFPLIDPVCVASAGVARVTQLSHGNSGRAAIFFRSSAFVEANVGKWDAEQELMSGNSNSGGPIAGGAATDPSDAKANDKGIIPENASPGGAADQADAVKLSKRNFIMVLVAAAIVLAGGIYVYKTHALDGGPTSKTISAKTAT